MRAEMQPESESEGRIDFTWSFERGDGPPPASYTPAGILLQFSGNILKS